MRRESALRLESRSSSSPEHDVMERSLVRAFWSKLKKVNTVCATLSGIVLLFMAFSITVDVFMRYALGRPTIWITEVSTYLFLYVIYPQRPLPCSRGHISRSPFSSVCLEERPSESSSS
jgi:hypothetical protein